MTQKYKREDWNSSVITGKVNIRLNAKLITGATGKPRRFSSQLRRGQIDVPQLLHRPKLILGHAQHDGGRIYPPDHGLQCTSTKVVRPLSKDSEKIRILCTLSRVRLMEFLLFSIKTI